MDSLAIETTRAHLTEVFEPAVRWLRSSPAERDATDHIAGFHALVDLAWPGGWKVSFVRQAGEWIVTAARDLNGEPLSATAKEIDYLTALVALYEGLLRRLDKIEAKQGQMTMELAA